MTLMPSSLIEIRRHCSPGDEMAMIDAVHEALVVAFRIPVNDKHVRLIAHEPHRFSHSPDLTDPDLYTLVSIDCFAGRSLDAKRHLYREIVDRLSTLGIPRDHITILVRDSHTDNWGIRGGRAASDVELGFEVEV